MAASQSTFPGRPMLPSPATIMYLPLDSSTADKIRREPRWWIQFFGGIALACFSILVSLLVVQYLLIPTLQVVETGLDDHIQSSLNLAQWFVFTPDNAAALIQFPLFYGLVGYLIAVLTPLLHSLFIVTVAWRPSYEFSLRTFGRDFMYGALYGTIPIVAAMGIVVWTGDYAILEFHSFDTFAMIIGVSIASAVLTETLFRGTMQRLLDKTFGSLSALVFVSMIHGLILARLAGELTFATISGSIIFSMLCGSAYLATRRLWLPIGLHFAWLVVSEWVLSVGAFGPKFGLFLVSFTGDPIVTGGSLGFMQSVPAQVCNVLMMAVLLGLAYRKHSLQTMMLLPRPIIRLTGTIPILLTSACTDDEAKRYFDYVMSLTYQQDATEDPTDFISPSRDVKHDMSLEKWAVEQGITAFNRDSHHIQNNGDATVESQEPVEATQSATPVGSTPAGSTPAGTTLAKQPTVLTRLFGAYSRKAEVGETAGNRQGSAVVPGEDVHGLPTIGAVVVGHGGDRQTAAGETGEDVDQRTTTDVDRQGSGVVAGKAARQQTTTGAGQLAEHVGHNETLLDEDITADRPLVLHGDADDVAVGSAVQPVHEKLTPMRYTRVFGVSQFEKLTSDEATQDYDREIVDKALLANILEHEETHNIAQNQKLYEALEEKTVVLDEALTSAIPPISAPGPSNKYSLEKVLASLETVDTAAYEPTVVVQVTPPLGRYSSGYESYESEVPEVPPVPQPFLSLPTERYGTPRPHRSDFGPDEEREYRGRFARSSEAEVPGVAEVPEEFNRVGRPEKPYLGSGLSAAVAHVDPFAHVEEGREYVETMQVERVELADQLRNYGLLGNDPYATQPGGFVVDEGHRGQRDPYAARDPHAAQPGVTARSAYAPNDTQPGRFLGESRGNLRGRSTFAASQTTSKDGISLADTIRKAQDISDTVAQIQTDELTTAELRRFGIRGGFDTGPLPVTPRPRGFDNPAISRSLANVIEEINARRQARNESQYSGSPIGGTPYSKTVEVPIFQASQLQRPPWVQHRGESLRTNQPDPFVWLPEIPDHVEYSYQENAETTPEHPESMIEPPVKLSYGWAPPMQVTADPDEKGGSNVTLADFKQGQHRRAT